MNRKKKWERKNGTRGIERAYYRSSMKATGKGRSLWTPYVIWKQAQAGVTNG